VTILVVHHRVRDFDAWKPVFDEHEEIRRKHGATRHWLYHAPGDGNDVVVALQMPSPEAAQSFMGDPSLADAMREAGVEGRPTIHVWQEVEDRTY
jgi:hypothetical protein